MSFRFLLSQWDLLLQIQQPNLWKECPTPVSIHPVTLPSVHCGLAWTHQSPTAAPCSGQHASPDLILLGCRGAGDWVNGACGWSLLSAGTLSSWLRPASGSCCWSRSGPMHITGLSSASPLAAHVLRVIELPRGCPSHQQACTSRTKPPALALWLWHHSANHLCSPAHLGAPLLDVASTSLLQGTWPVPTLPTRVLLPTRTSLPVRELSLLVCHLLLTSLQIPAR